MAVPSSPYHYQYTCLGQLEEEEAEEEEGEEKKTEVKKGDATMSLNR